MGPEELILNAEVAPEDPGDLQGMKGEEGEALSWFFYRHSSATYPWGGWMGESGPLETQQLFPPRVGRPKKHNSGLNAWVTSTVATNG